MRTRITQFALFAALLRATPASGDVFIEITPYDRPPNGLRDSDIIFNQPTSYDVFIWGSGADAALRSADFDLAGPGYGQFVLGTADPGALFQFSAPGVVQSHRIEHVQLLSVSGVALSQSPATALLAYRDFFATAEQAGAIMEPSAWSVVTNASNNPALHLIGVQETPEPTTLALFSGLALLVARRGLRRAARS